MLAPAPCSFPATPGKNAGRRDFLGRAIRGWPLIVSRTFCTKPPHAAMREASSPSPACARGRSQRVRGSQACLQTCSCIFFPCTCGYAALTGPPARPWALFLLPAAPCAPCRAPAERGSAAPSRARRRRRLSVGRKDPHGWAPAATGAAKPGGGVLPHFLRRRAQQLGSHRRVLRRVRRERLSAPVAARPYTHRRRRRFRI